MSLPESGPRKVIVVTPALSEALEGASRLYENIADGEYLVFARSKYKYLEPDLAIMRDRARVLKDHVRQLNNQPLADDSTLKP